MTKIKNVKVLRDSGIKKIKTGLKKELDATAMLIDGAADIVLGVIYLPGDFFRFLGNKLEDNQSILKANFEQAKKEIDELLKKESV